MTSSGQATAVLITGSVWLVLLAFPAMAIAGGACPAPRWSREWSALR